MALACIFQFIHITIAIHSFTSATTIATNTNPTLFSAENRLFMRFLIENLADLSSFFCFLDAFFTRFQHVFSRFPERFTTTE